MWIVLSFGAMGFLAVMMILNGLRAKEQLPSTTILFYLFLFGCLFDFIYLKIQEPLVATSQTPANRLWLMSPSLLISWPIMLVIAVAALASILGNLCMVQALPMVRNPGYVTAIATAYSPLVALASILVFHSEFSLQKGIGVFLCAGGIALVSLPEFFSLPKW